VFNLLPVPALDGCRMVFILIEWIRRKPINRKVEAYINGIGLVVLFALVLLIDLLKL
jgi:regulator of sigma E protease